MSTFQGVIREYPFISVDNFTQRPEVCAYLLSHCHSDHLKGLSTKALQSSTIYCSQESANLLLDGSLGNGKYRHLSTALQIIAPMIPTRISTAAGDSVVVVTAYPANHCPGSLMFVLEGVNGTVLYTGDFRLDGPSAFEELRRCSLFSYDSGLPRFFDCVYLDTTFCGVDYRSFPSRSETVSKISSLVSTLGANMTVLLDTKTTLGYESIWQELYQTFGHKVHVSADTFQLYSALANCQIGEDYSRFLTADHDVHTRFHACGIREFYRQCSRRGDAVVRIIPTAMFHTTAYQEADTGAGSETEALSNRYRFAFSMHPSLDELIEFIAFLRPKQVYPCVFSGAVTEENVRGLLQWFKPYLRSSPLQCSYYIDTETVADTKDLKVDQRARIEKWKAVFASGRLPVLNCLRN